MILPPVLLRYRHRRPGGRGRGLWLPLVLLWPFLLLAAAVLSPLAVLRALLSGRWRTVPRALLLGPWLILFFCRLRRFRVEIRDGEHEFLLAVH